MHRFFLVTMHKGNGNQIQKSIEKTLQAKLGVSVLPSAMLHHLLPDFREAIPFGQKRNVAVHFSIDMDILHHLIAVGLQSTIKIVQLNPRNPAGHSIEEFGRDGFGNGIMTFLFPARDHIQPSLDHRIETWDFVRTVLEVCIHGDHHFPRGALKACV